MSTLTGKPDLTHIESPADLFGYFARFIKKPEERKVGLEAEFIGVDSKTGKALLYQGTCGTEALLKRFAEKFSYKLLLDEGSVIGIVSPQGAVIGLEPGGQLELSAPPLKTIFEVEASLECFLSQLKTFHCECQEAKWLSVGIHPFSSLDEIPWVPKTRYKILADYLKTRGSLSHHMMKRTATNQMNFDYTSEEEAMEMLRVSLGVTSIASAIFANASISGGKPNGFISERLHIWLHTSPDRSGLIVSFTHPGKSFQDYLDYVLDTPMIFMVKDEKWIPMKGMIFRDYIKKGYGDYRATLSDFELHLSTMFPEVRFKQYMEIRGMDAQRASMIPTLAAFWKGIVYDSGARQSAWKLVASFSDEERLRLRDDVPKRGLHAEVQGRPIKDLALELVDISRQGLKNQGASEEKFLDPLTSNWVEKGRSPGQALLEKWESNLKTNPIKLLDELSVEF